MRKYGRVWEGMGVLPPDSAIACVGGITQRIARRSGASTGCSGLCPLPILSHTFPYFLIIHRAANPASLHYAVASGQYLFKQSTTILA